MERETALRLAHDALRLATAGRGSAVLFQGLAGLGKSTLLAAVADDARSAGATVLVASGRELEQDVPFGVALQLLEARAAGKEGAALFSGPETSALLHGLYRLSADVACAAPPLLIVVDDADLADAATLRFLLYLLERVAELPAAIVLGAACAERSASPDLVERVIGHPRVQIHSLAALSAAGTDRRLRDSWLSDADDDVCRAVREASAGNPALIDALGAELQGRARRGALDADGLSALAPRGVARNALAQARAVDPEAPALLRAAGVLGAECELRHAAELAGLDGVAAAALVPRLVATGLLRDGANVDFAQPVVGRALRASQSQAERAAANLRAAEQLVAEEASPERVAPHLLEAPRAGNGWAVTNLCSAAEVALGRGAPDDAVRYLRRALEEPPPAELRAHVLLELGRAEATAGDPGAFTRLSEAVERAPDRRERARRGLATGRTLFALGRPGEAAETFSRALRECEQDDELRTRLDSAYRAVSWVRKGRTTAVDPDLLPPSHNGDRAAQALAAFDAATRSAPAEETRALAIRALDRGALLDDETADGIAYYFAAAALVMTEDLQTAEAALTAAIEEARSRGSVLGFATASLVRSLAIGRRGRVADAVADARLALAGERHGWRIGSMAARVLLAANLIEMGDIDAAERHIAAAEAAGDEPDPAWPSLLICRGELQLATDHPAEALADFRACGEGLDKAGISNPALLPWRAGAARAHAALGEGVEARRVAEQELALARAAGAPGMVGSSLRTLGIVTGGMRGIELLEAAVEQLEGSQLALERARALVDLGAARRRLGRRTAARDPLRRGADLAERCGASALAARAMNELRLAGAKPRRIALHGLEALTPRERETAELAARGHSNREIAKALFVTVKTVEFHLGHSYGKLGVSSRRELRDLLGGQEQGGSSRT